MTPHNPARAQIESTIAAYFDEAGRPLLVEAASRTPSHALQGRWRIAWPGVPSLAGALHITPGPQPNTLVAAVDVFQGQALVRKYGGPVVIEDDHTIRIDWSGAKSHPMAGMVPTGGVMRIRTDRRPYEGIEAAVGESETAFTLSRLR